MRFQPGFRFGASTAVLGALYLLTGETDGFAIDATTYPATVAVKDTGTPANDLSNVGLDESNLVNSGTSPKMVHNASSPYVRWSPHNLSSYSSDLTGWTNYQSTRTTTTLTMNAGVQQGFLYKSVSGSVTGNTYTMAADLSAGTHNYVTISVENGAAAYAIIVVNLSNGTISQTAGTLYVSSSISSLGGGVYRASLVFILSSGTINTARLSLAEAATGNTFAGDGYPNWAGTTAGTETANFGRIQINRGSTETAYLVTTTTARIGIPLSYDAAAAQYGILVEPAASNVTQYSEDFSNGANWTVNSITVATNDTTAPDGTSNADKWTAGAANDTHRFYQNKNLTGAAPASYSAYFKAGTHNYVYLSILDPGTEWAGAVFDLSAGSGTATQTATSVSTIQSTSITSIGGGWLRATLTATIANANNYFILGMAGAATGNTFSGGEITWNAAGTETVYCWGAQSETGTVATSYIPTLGSTVTRAKDDINSLTSSMPYISTEGTMYADVKSPDAGNYRTLIALNTDASDDSQRVLIQRYISSTDVHYVVTTTSGSGQADLDPGSITSNVRYQGSFAFKANDFAASADGGAVSTDVSGTMPTAATQLAVGNEQGGLYQLNGYIYRVIYVPRRVADGDLPTWRYNF
jgi:hypothetical protein